MSRIDAATILQVLGYRDELDFLCASAGPTATTITWFHPTDPQPSDAVLNAVSPAQVQAYFAQHRRQRILNALTDAQDANAARDRAIALVLKDVYDITRNRINAILDAIDAATNLANLKSAVAAINDLPPQTNADLLQLLRNHVNAGEVD